MFHILLIYGSLTIGTMKAKFSLSFENLTVALQHFQV